MITNLRDWLLEYAAVCSAMGDLAKADQIRQFVASELGDERTTALADQLRTMLDQLGVMA